MDVVFPSASTGFNVLQTFWASDLLMARSILSKVSRLNRYGNTGSFQNLQHLQLRSCPSLQFVLPLWVSSFPSLETLHLIHCGNLSHVFVQDEKYPKEMPTFGVLFPKLATIHLHDLPKLQEICEGARAREYQDQRVLEPAPASIRGRPGPRRDEAGGRDREGSVGCSGVGQRPPPRPLRNAGPLALLQGEAAQGVRPQVLIIHANDF